MFSVRLYFKKTGPSIYISHLDLMRCFERCMRRAEIPFWYTEGFNPRPFLSFAQPLSLGTVGLREIVDIRLIEDMSFDTLISRMNKVLPEGLEILDAVSPVEKVNDIASSRYTIILHPESISCDELYSKLDAFLSQESIMTQKLNKKKKLVELDLKPFVRSFEVSADNDTVILKAVLASGCTENCNPSLVLNAFYANCGIEEQPCRITRECILDANGMEFA